MASQCIDLEQREQVNPGLSSVSPARRSSNRRCRSRFTTLMTETTAAFQVRSSGYGRAGFIGLPEKALTLDATKRLQFNVHAAGWLYSTVLHRC